MDDAALCRILCYVLHDPSCLPNDVIDGTVRYTRMVSLPTVAVTSVRARIMKNAISWVLAFTLLVSILWLEGAYGFRGSFGIRVTHPHERIASTTTALSMGLVKSAVRIRDSMLSKDRR